VQSLEQAFLKHVEHEAAVLMLHVITNQQKVASDAAAAAQTQAISTATSLKEVMHAAGAAAAKAYEAMAGIPVIGPVLGAAAAGATFAGVMAFESMAGAEQGVPRDMPIFAHQGEMILPRNISESVKTMADNGGSNGGGDTHIHMHVSAFDGKTVSDFFHSNRGLVAKTLTKAVRNGMRSSR
jgi:hypothetical protein